MVRNRTSFLLAVAMLMFIAAYYSAIRILVEKWYSSDEYSHSFLVVPIIGYIAWQNRKNIDSNTIRYSMIGLAGLVVSSILYYFGLLTEVHTMILLTMYSAFVSILIFLLGIQSIWVFFTPLFLLLILIPIPDQLYIKLTFPLQLKVSEASEIIIRALDIPIFRQGNVMNTPGKTFEVVDACSGLRSIIALTSLSIIVGYFMLKKPFSKVLLLFMSIPIAILVNIFRVVLMITAFHWYNLDLTGGTLHSGVGLAVFAVSLILLIITQKILELWENK